jgi:hypothetical protein
MAFRGKQSDWTHINDNNLLSSWPALTHGCPVQQLRQRMMDNQSPTRNSKHALPGLDPGKTVFGLPVFRLGL